MFFLTLSQGSVLILVQDNVFLSFTRAGLEMIRVPVRSALILAGGENCQPRRFFSGETWRLGRTRC